MSDQGLISIIIPTYNRAGYIAETIRSVLEQTYKDFEIIVVDDGSTDPTEEIVKSIKDSRIKYIWQENSGLPAVARNNGIKIAQGEYIAFLDSDDIWMKDKLVKQLKIFDTHPDLLVVATNGFVMKNSVIKGRLARIRDKRISFQKMLKENMVINSSVLIRADAVRDIGFLDEDKRLRASEDFDFWLRVLQYKDNSIYLLKDKLIIYRVHESNILDSKSKTLFERRVQIIFSKYPNFDQVYLCKAYKSHMRNLIYDGLTISIRSKEASPIEIFLNNSLGLLDRISIIAKYSILCALPFLRKRAFRQLKI